VCSPSRSPASPTTFHVSAPSPGACAPHADRWSSRRRWPARHPPPPPRRVAAEELLLLDPHALRARRTQALDDPLGRLMLPRLAGGALDRGQRLDDLTHR